MPNRSEFNRRDRVRKAIIREFSDVLMHEIKEPLLMNQVISVTDAEVSGDMQHVKVFVSILAEPSLQNEIMALLKENTSRIRMAIGQRIRLRHTPEIDIRLDQSLERGSRVTQLLHQISTEETQQID